MTERRSDFGMTSPNGQSGPAKQGAGRRSATTPPGRHTQWRALGLAVVAHSVLFTVLFFGGAWKTTDDCKNGIPTNPGYFEAMWDSVRVVFGYPPKPRKECMVSVEMWSPTANTGAGRAVPVRPAAPLAEAEPEPAKPVVPPILPPPAPPTPIPVRPQPVPAPPPPKPVTPPTPRIPEEIKPLPKPDLSLEREKAAREKLQREKTEREKAEREKAERDKIDRAKAEKEKAERLKAEKDKAERAEKERQDRDRAQKEKLDRERTEREKSEREKSEREKAERERAERERLDRERIEREKLEREKLERERVERQRAEREATEQRRQRDIARDIARAQAEAGEFSRPAAGGSPSGSTAGTSSSGSTGSRNAEWAARVKSAIRENTTFSPPPDMSGNPQVIFRITLSPDCALGRIERISPSGVPSWDQAAERAIRKTNPFPRFPGGQCPPSFELSSRPND